MRFALVFLTLLSAACAPARPARYVLEKDLGPYRFRRYQRVLDVELAVSGNPAVGHTGTYVRGGKTVQVVPVFVTAYSRSAGLADAVRGQLRSMEGYGFALHKEGRSNLFRMLADDRTESWLVWVSSRHVVKLGSANGSSEAPKELVEAYLDRYPSDLDEQGKVQEQDAKAPPEP